jgi:hypothetical protein
MIATRLIVMFVTTTPPTPSGLGIILETSAESFTHTPQLDVQAEQLEQHVCDLMERVSNTPKTLKRRIKVSSTYHYSLKSSHRVKFEEAELPQAKRAKTTPMPHEDSATYGLIKLQMIAITSYEQDLEEARSIIGRLEQEVKRLNSNLERNERRLGFLDEEIRKRGRELKRQGEILIKVADKEVETI